MPAEPFDFAEERDGFIRFAQRRALGPSTASLVRAAEERDIPWIRLNDQSLIQFGHGSYQQRIQATVTSRTRTSRSRSPPTRRRPTRSSATSACRCRSSAWCSGRTRRSTAAPAHRLPGGGQAVQRATTAAASRSTCATTSQVVAGLPRRRRRSAAASSSRPSSRATTTACWWSNGELVAVAEARAGPRGGRRRAHDRRAGRRS